jgi:hypothetical protein
MDAEHNDIYNKTYSIFQSVWWLIGNIKQKHQDHRASNCVYLTKI